MELATEKKRIHSKQDIPEAFIYEIMDGKPLYYKGYKKAIRNHQNAESIMGASSLQVILLQYFSMLLYKCIDLNKYWIMAGEPGLHLGKGNNLAGDLLVISMDDLPASMVSKKYTSVPAVLHIEIDIAADLEYLSETNYITIKTNKLLAFGTKKVIWVFTSMQKVMIAESDKEDWIWINWSKSISLWDTENFNIGDFLTEKGIVLED